MLDPRQAVVRDVRVLFRLCHAREGQAKDGDYRQSEI
jgi:hypothetical protein